MTRDRAARAGAAGSAGPLVIDAANVGDYLRARGVGGAPYTDAETLAGGVSNAVVRVTSQGRRLVVKQSLETLAVADLWTAPTSRVLTEAEVTALLGSVTPGRVAPVLDSDEVAHALVIESAPDDWVDWRSELMRGVVDQEVGRTLGTVLATWHGRTSEPSGLLKPGFDEHDAFEALRIDPYFRTAAARAPEVSEALLSVVHAMASRRWCLVHGDFSPKNVLVGPGASAPEGSGPHGRSPARPLWVIDFEVAHRGDPAFDVAFLLTHLLMKSYALPASAAALDAARNAFVTAYVTGPRCAELDWPHTSRLAGALLVARVRGKSPAGYLDGRARQQVWDLGVSLLREPAGTDNEVTCRRDEQVP